MPRPSAAQLDELLGRCMQLRAFARTHGFELDKSPEDLSLLDQAIEEASDLERSELGGLGIAGLGTEAGLYLGTVITATIVGARWRLWPNGHPVVRLPSGRDLDVVALANDRMHTGVPLLASIYADAAALWVL